MHPSDVTRAVGEALVAARAELNRADRADDGVPLGESAASIGETLIAVAPQVDGLPASEALRNIGAAIGSGAPSAFATIISAGLVDASEAVDDRLDGRPLVIAAGFVRAVATAVPARSGAGRGEGALMKALAPAADALETAAEADVPPAEGFALAMLAAYEAVDETGGAAEPLVIAIALRAAAQALA